MSRGIGIKTLKEECHTEQCEHPIFEPDEPRGYMAWSDWAEEKSKTHNQLLCPHCGLWVIWKPKRRRANTKRGKG